MSVKRRMIKEKRGKKRERQKEREKNVNLGVFGRTSVQYLLRELDS